MPNKDKLQPSLQALTTFESAARLGSFTAAAEELGISQPAVSHAVRQVEALLQVPLFERLHRGVALTVDGRKLYEHTHSGLQHIYEAVREIQADQQRVSTVSLSVSTALATYWLMPRVARFQMAYPNIELNIITKDTDSLAIRDDIDLTIPLGGGPWLNVKRWFFTAERIYPVCSPLYIERHGCFDLAGLADQALIHLHERYRQRCDWSDWFGHLEMTWSPSVKGLTFNDYSVVIQAALESQGVALGWDHIVGPLVEDGRLIRLFSDESVVQTNNPFYLLSKKNHPQDSAALRLREWLVNQAAEGS